MASFGHDDDYRLTDLDVADGGTVIQDLEYGYDGRNDVTSVTDAGQDPADGWTYVYDELARVTQGVSAALGTFDYTCDGVGNRLTRTVTRGGAVVKTHAHSGTSNRPATVAGGGTTRTFGYDAAGNVTSDDEPGGAGMRTLSYNAAGRLASVSGSASLAAIRNARGLRVKRTKSGTTTRYAYDLSGELIAEHVGGSATRESIQAAGPALALGADPAGAPGALTYIHADHLGRPRLMSDRGQRWPWKPRMSTFGEEPVELGNRPSGRVRRAARAEGRTGWHGPGMRTYSGRPSAKARIPPCSRSSRSAARASTTSSPWTSTSRATAWW
jgi:YD repeat-containing protein